MFFPTSCDWLQGKIAHTSSNIRTLCLVPPQLYYINYIAHLNLCKYQYNWWQILSFTSLLTTAVHLILNTVHRTSHCIWEAPVITLYADKFTKCTSHIKYKGQYLCSQKRANANVVPASAADPEYLHFDELVKNGAVSLTGRPQMLNVWRPRRGRHYNDVLPSEIMQLLPK